MRISKHISYKEATRSNTAIRFGILNHPSQKVLDVMRLTSNKIFEPLRRHFGVPIYISSFYRSWLLNKKLGGSINSGHPLGEAIDLDDILGGVTNSDMFYWIKNNLEFDQLIWEYGDDDEPKWIHVSYRLNNNRNQVLKAVRYRTWYGSYKTRYEIF